MKYHKRIIFYLVASVMIVKITLWNISKSQTLLEQVQLPKLQWLKEGTTMISHPSTGRSKYEKLDERDPENVIENKPKEEKQLTVNKMNKKQMLEPPDYYLHSYRFDFIVKIVYAYFFAFMDSIPKSVSLVYAEHLRVWNNFKEHCYDIDKRMTDFKKPCKPKKSKDDFFSSFHNTINDIRKQGFKAEKSEIPVSKDGIVLNGAHRLSAGIILDKRVKIQHLNFTGNKRWDFKFFMQKGLKKDLMDLAVLEYMKIQYKLNLTSQISIMSLYKNGVENEAKMMSIFSRHCSRDGKILYEKRITLTRHGIKQLMYHMYGMQSWIDAKISQMNYLFSSSETVKVRMIFFFGKNVNSLKICKYGIRSLYNSPNKKSSVHIPDTSEENFLLAQMVLNNNSLSFLNYATKGQNCHILSKEIARRSLLPMSITLPDIYIGRDDIMLDSGGVLDIFGIRKGTDIDILFLKDVDERVLGEYRGVNIEAHTFVMNNIKRGRPWGQEHLSQNLTNWDLFFDTWCYGYCFGLKFVSLPQLIRYKTRRNEPGKDASDVKSIRKFLEHVEFPKTNITYQKRN